jgi:TRAP-type mannitol/chloroaromatic compound transport system permease small subunit
VKNITIGIRTQSLLVISLAILWHVLWCFYLIASLISHLGERDGFWVDFLVFVFVLLPFVMLIFGTIVLLSYWRTERAHGSLVCLAVLAAVSPWILLAVVLMYQ